MASQTLSYSILVNDSQLRLATAHVQAFNAELAASTVTGQKVDVAMRSVGRRAAQVGGFFTRNITLPFVLGGVAAAKYTAQFQREQAKVQGLAGATAGQIDKIRHAVLSLASHEATLGPAQLETAIFHLRSAGLSAADSIRILKPVSEAAVAGLGSLDHVTTAVTSAMDSYGFANLNAAQRTKLAAHFTDVLIKTVQKGNIPVQELAGSIGRVTSIASAMGISFDQVGAAIASITRQMPNANLAVTGLRATLATFLKDQPQTEKALNRIGASGAGVRDAFKKSGLFPTLLALRQQFNQLGPQAKAVNLDTLKAAFDGSGAAGAKLVAAIGGTDTAMAKAFPNIRALAAFLIITGKNAAFNANIFAELDATTKHVGESLKIAFGAFATSDVGRFRLAISNLQAEAIQIGPTFLKAGASLLQFGNGVIQFAQHLPFKGLFKDIGIALLLLGPIASLFGRTAQAASGAVTLWGRWQVAATKAALATHGINIAEDEALIAHRKATQLFVSDQNRWTAAINQTAGATAGLAKASAAMAAAGGIRGALAAASGGAAIFGKISSGRRPPTGTTPGGSAPALAAFSATSATFADRKIAVLERQRLREFQAAQERSSSAQRGLNQARAAGVAETTAALKTQADLEFNNMRAARTNLNVVFAGDTQLLALDEKRAVAMRQITAIQQQGKAASREELILAQDKLAVFEQTITARQRELAINPLFVRNGQVSGQNGFARVDQRARELQGGPAVIPRATPQALAASQAGATTAARFASLQVAANQRVQSSEVSLAAAFEKEALARTAAQKAAAASALKAAESATFEARVYRTALFPADQEALALAEQLVVAEDRLAAARARGSAAAAEEAEATRIGAQLGARQSVLASSDSAIAASTARIVGAGRIVTTKWGTAMQGMRSAAKLSFDFIALTFAADILGKVVFNSHKTKEAVTHDIFDMKKSFALWIAASLVGVAALTKGIAALGATSVEALSFRGVLGKSALLFSSTRAQITLVLGAVLALQAAGVHLGTALNAAFGVAAIAGILKLTRSSALASKTIVGAGVAGKEAGAASALGAAEATAAVNTETVSYVRLTDAERAAAAAGALSGLAGAAGGVAGALGGAAGKKLLVVQGGRVVEREVGAGVTGGLLGRVGGLKGIFGKLIGAGQWKAAFSDGLALRTLPRVLSTTLRFGLGRIGIPLLIASTVGSFFSKDSIKNAFQSVLGNRIGGFVGGIAGFFGHGNAPKPTRDETAQAGLTPFEKQALEPIPVDFKLKDGTKARTAIIEAFRQGADDAAQSIINTVEFTIARQKASEVLTRFKREGKTAAASVVQDFLDAQKKVGVGYTGIVEKINSSVQQAFDSHTDRLLDRFDRRTDAVLRNFDDKTQAMDEAFDRQTQKLEDKLKVTVKVPKLNETFTVQVNGKTPAEKELDALDKIQEKRTFQRDIFDARQNLTQALQVGDPGAIRDAERQLQDAQSAKQRFRAQQRATVERKALDTQGKAATDHFEQQRAAEKKQRDAVRAIRRQGIADAREDARRDLQATRQVLSEQLAEMLKKEAALYKAHKISLAQYKIEVGGIMDRFKVNMRKYGHDAGEAYRTRFMAQLNLLNKDIILAGSKIDPFPGLRGKGAAGATSVAGPGFNITTVTNPGVARVGGVSAVPHDARNNTPLIPGQPNFNAQTTAAAGSTQIVITIPSVGTQPGQVSTQPAPINTKPGSVPTQPSTTKTVPAVTPAGTKKSTADERRTHRLQQDSRGVPTAPAIKQQLHLASAIPDFQPPPGRHRRAAPGQVSNEFNPNLINQIRHGTQFDDILSHFKTYFAGQNLTISEYNNFLKRLAAAAKKFAATPGVTSQNFDAGNFISGLRSNLSQFARAATGTVVPGHGSGDTVPALLTPGEIVFNRRQQLNLGDMLGTPGASAHQLFAHMNRPRKFATGGVVTDPQGSLLPLIERQISVLLYGRRLSLPGGVGVGQLQDNREVMQRNLAATMDLVKQNVKAALEGESHMYTDAKTGLSRFERDVHRSLSDFSTQAGDDGTKIGSAFADNIRPFFTKVVATITTDMKKIRTVVSQTATAIATDTGSLISSVAAGSLRGSGPTAKGQGGRALQAVTSGGVQYSNNQIFSLLRGVGFNKKDARNFVGIAGAESGGRVNVLNDNAKTGDYSIGLFQENFFKSLGPARTRRYAPLFGLPPNIPTKDFVNWLASHPQAQAIIARDLFQSSGYAPWMGDPYIKQHPELLHKRRLWTGGIAPGAGSQDTVPAMLTPGEIVFNRRQQHNLGRMLGVPGAGPHELFDQVSRFADGGVTKPWDWPMSHAIKSGGDSGSVGDKPRRGPELNVRRMSQLVTPRQIRKQIGRVWGVVGGAIPGAGALPPVFFGDDVSKDVADVSHDQAYALTETNLVSHGVSHVLPRGDRPILLSNAAAAGLAVGDPYAYHALAHEFAHDFQQPAALMNQALAEGGAEKFAQAMWPRLRGRFFETDALSGQHKRRVLRSLAFRIVGPYRAFADQVGQLGPEWYLHDQFVPGKPVPAPFSASKYAPKSPAGRLGMAWDWPWMHYAQGGVVEKSGARSHETLTGAIERMWGEGRTTSQVERQVEKWHPTWSFPKIQAAIATAQADRSSVQTRPGHESLSDAIWRMRRERRFSDDAIRLQVKRWHPRWTDAKIGNAIEAAYRAHGPTQPAFAPTSSMSPYTSGDLGILHRAYEHSPIVQALGNLSNPTAFIKYMIGSGFGVVPITKASHDFGYDPSGKTANELGRSLAMFGAQFVPIGGAAVRDLSVGMRPIVAEKFSALRANASAFRSDPRGFVSEVPPRFQKTWHDALFRAKLKAKFSPVGRGAAHFNKGQRGYRALDRVLERLGAHEVGWRGNLKLGEEMVVPINEPGKPPRLITKRSGKHGFMETLPGSERPPEYLFRAVSDEEYLLAKQRGYFKSDGRMNLVASEGTVADFDDPSYYLPGKLASSKAGVHPGRIIRIRYRDADGWRLGTDGYVKTNERIPFGRVDLAPRVNVVRSAGHRSHHEVPIRENAAARQGQFLKWLNYEKGDGAKALRSYIQGARDIPGLYQDMWREAFWPGDEGSVTHDMRRLIGFMKQHPLPRRVGAFLSNDRGAAMIGPSFGRKFSVPLSKESLPVMHAELEKLDALYEKFISNFVGGKLTKEEMAEQRQINTLNGIYRRQNSGKTRSGKLSGSSGHKVQWMRQNIAARNRTQAENDLLAIAERNPKNAGARNFMAMLARMEDLRGEIFRREEEGLGPLAGADGHAAGHHAGHRDPHQMTLKELLGHKNPRREGDRSRDVSDVVNNPEYREGTLADYAHDNFMLREWLGGSSHTPGWDVSYLANRVRRGQRITVYRATDTEGRIFPGAYVTPSKQYAASHLEGPMHGHGRIISREAYPDELHAVNPDEFFFVPRDIAKYHAEEIKLAHARGEPGKFAGGGPVPGFGNRDSVPAMLTPGEVVFNRGQQRNLGHMIGMPGAGPHELFAEVTRARRFTDGGPVSANDARDRHVGRVTQTEQTVSRLGLSWAGRLFKTVQELSRWLTARGQSWQHFAKVHPEAARGLEMRSPHSRPDDRGAGRHFTAGGVASPWEWMTQHYADGGVVRGGSALKRAIQQLHAQRYSNEKIEGQVQRWHPNWRKQDVIATVYDAEIPRFVGPQLPFRYTDPIELGLAPLPPLGQVTPEQAARIVTGWRGNSVDVAYLRDKATHANFGTAPPAVASQPTARKVATPAQRLAGETNVVAHDYPWVKRQTILREIAARRLSQIKAATRVDDPTVGLGWSPQDRAWANQENLANNGVLGLALRNIIESLVPVRAIKQIADHKHVTLGAIESDLLTAALTGTGVGVLGKSIAAGARGADSAVEAIQAVRKGSQFMHALQGSKVKGAAALRSYIDQARAFPGVSRELWRETFSTGKSQTSDSISRAIAFMRKHALDRFKGNQIPDEGRLPYLVDKSGRFWMAKPGESHTDVFRDYKLSGVLRDYSQGSVSYEREADGHFALGVVPASPERLGQGNAGFVQPPELALRQAARARLKLGADRPRTGLRGVVHRLADDRGAAEIGPHGDYPNISRIFKTPAIARMRRALANAPEAETDVEKRRLMLALQRFYHNEWRQDLADFEIQAGNQEKGFTERFRQATGRAPTESEIEGFRQERLGPAPVYAPRTADQLAQELLRPGPFGVSETNHPDLPRGQRFSVSLRPNDRHDSKIGDQVEINSRALLHHYGVDDARGVVVGIGDDPAGGRSFDVRLANGKVASLHQGYFSNLTRAPLLIRRGRSRPINEAQFFRIRRRIIEGDLARERERGIVSDFSGRDWSTLVSSLANEDLTALRQAALDQLHAVGRDTPANPVRLPKGARGKLHSEVEKYLQFFDEVHPPGAVKKMAQRAASDLTAPDFGLLFHKIPEHAAGPAAPLLDHIVSSVEEALARGDYPAAAELLKGTLNSAQGVFTYRPIFERKLREVEAKIHAQGGHYGAALDIFEQAKALGFDSNDPFTKEGGRLLGNAAVAADHLSPAYRDTVHNMLAQGEYAEALAYVQKKVGDHDSVAIIQALKALVGHNARTPKFLPQGPDLGLQIVSDLSGASADRLGQEAHRYLEFINAAREPLSAETVKFSHKSLRFAKNKETATDLNFLISNMRHQGEKPPHFVGDPKDYERYLLAENATLASKVGKVLAISYPELAPAFQGALQTRDLGALREIYRALAVGKARVSPLLRAVEDRAALRAQGAKELSEKGFEGLYGYASADQSVKNVDRAIELLSSVRRGGKAGGRKAFEQVFGALRIVDSPYSVFSGTKVTDTAVSIDRTKDKFENLLRLGGLDKRQAPPLKDIRAGREMLEFIKKMLQSGGGPIKKATGGLISGSGTGDTVPALLTPGEIVLNRSQQRGLADRLGVPGASPSGLFSMIAQRFAFGGVAGAESRVSSIFPLPTVRELISVLKDLTKTVKTGGPGRSDARDRHTVIVTKTSAPHDPNSGLNLPGLNLPAYNNAFIKKLAQQALFQQSIGTDSVKGQQLAKLQDELVQGGTTKTVGGRKTLVKDSAARIANLKKELKQGGSTNTATGRFVRDTSDQLAVIRQELTRGGVVKTTGGKQVFTRDSKARLLQLRKQFDPVSVDSTLRATIPHFGSMPPDQKRALEAQGARLQAHPVLGGLITARPTGVSLGRDPRIKDVRYRAFQNPQGIPSAAFPSQSRMLTKRELAASPGGGGGGVNVHVARLDINIHGGSGSAKELAREVRREFDLEATRVATRRRGVMGR